MIDRLGRVLHPGHSLTPLHFSQQADWKFFQVCVRIPISQLADPSVSPKYGSLPGLNDGEACLRSVWEPGMLHPRTSSFNVLIYLGKI